MLLGSKAVVFYALFQGEQEAGMQKEVLKENDEQAREYNPEKTRMIDFFVGQVMKKTRGKANPAKTMEMLREELAKYNK